MKDGKGVDSLDPEGRVLVAAYWWQRAAAEMTSWVGWQHVLGDLRAEGSPEPVIALGERAVADEYRHALWCRDWAERFGHACGEIRPREGRPFVLPGASDAENRLLRITLCCFTETVGCFILRHARPAIDAEPLRKLNQRHLADELQHGRACWAHLSTLDARKKEELRASIPQLLALLPHICCRDNTEEREELVPFGYFTPRLLRAALDDALGSVIRPGLEHLNLGQAA